MDELEDCMNQVYRMALAAMQSHTFWFYTRIDDSPFEEAIKNNGHFFYATHEAHLTMMFISLDCLYDDKAKLLNFEKLQTLLPTKLSADDCKLIRKKIEILRKQSRGIGIIRNNSFAHLSNYETRIAVGEKYGLNYGELVELCYGTLHLATHIGRLLGRDLPSAIDVNAKDVETIQGIFAKLHP